MILYIGKHTVDKVILLSTRREKKKLNTQKWEFEEVTVLSYEHHGTRMMSGPSIFNRYLCSELCPLIKLPSYEGPIYSLPHTEESDSFLKKSYNSYHYFVLYIGHSL